MGAPTHFAIGLILCAAVLHAVWNALVKGSADRVITLGLINLGHGLVGAVMVVLYLPPAREAWPFIAASTFIHYFYYGFLLVAYRAGDLSQVYPIARGVAPVLVALRASLVASGGGGGACHTKSPRVRIRSRAVGASSSCSGCGCMRTSCRGK